MIIVWGRMVATEDNFQSLLDMSMEHVHRSRQEPGCIKHSVQVDADNPMAIVFYEEWQSMSDLQQHFKVDASIQFVTAARRLANKDNFDMKMYRAEVIS